LQESFPNFLEFEEICNYLKAENLDLSHFVFKVALFPESIVNRKNVEEELHVFKMGVKDIGNGGGYVGEVFY